ncbi:helix-turn-helix domain-containing protein [Maribellus sediminis]|uniref:helix-turn-helix domain-containing protein n=1 Tax=Maribellus sediminis TaxID=2696285 RepID=UPI0014309D6C|nr:AraC family transcriptional regulator [Maribellus sediminis]
MVKSISLLLPIYVTLMWALVFLLKRNSPVRANKVLGLFMLAATLLYCSHAVFFHQFYHLYSFIDSLYLLTLLSLYPLFYGYILVLSTHELNLKKFRLNFLPAFILALSSLILTLVLSPEERVMYVKEVLISRNLKELNLFSITGIKGMVFLIARIAFIIQSIVYLLIGIRLANRYNVWLHEYFSNTEGRRMKWVRDISIIILVVSIAGIVFSLIGRSYFAHKPVSLLIPSFLFSTIYFIIGFNANQQEVLTENLVEFNTENEPKEPVHGQVSILKEKLLELFENEKIYTQTDLRITTLCEVLQTNRTYLSRLINVEFGMNFNEFVNHYRVREAEKLLSSDEHKSYTLEYIAEEAGFGTSNSFSRAFKEFNGITPGQYRKDDSQQKSS